MYTESVTWDVAGNAARQEQHGSSLHRAVPELVAERRRRLQAQPQFPQLLTGAGGPQASGQSRLTS